MNFIDSLATRFAKSIRNNYEDAASEKVLFYALSLLINTFTAYICTMLICALTNHLTQALLVLLLYTLLRIISGGCHLSTSLRCCIYSVFTLTIYAHSVFDFRYMQLGVIITVISAVILLVTAPEGLKGHSKIPEKYYIVLKYLSVSLVLSNLYFQLSTVAIALLMQAIYTTKFGYTMVSFIDKVVNYTLGKEVTGYEA